MTDKEFVELAKALYSEDGVLEVDDYATVSRSDDGTGAYVQAWVWVYATPKEEP